MAERRMMTKKVTDDDHFISLSSSAQALYLQLTMSADDDGFCNQVSTCMFKAHASTQDLEALLEKKYLLQFSNGVIVIKHWRMANALRKDRYTPTAFQEELAQLGIKDNGSYTLATNWQPDGNQLSTTWQPDGNQLATQNSIDKDSIDKDSVDKKSTAHARGEYGWVKLTDDQYSKLLADLGEEELTRCIRSIDESAQQTGNKNKWKDWNLIIRKCSRDGWGKTSSSRPAKQRNYVNAEEYYARPQQETDLDKLRAIIDMI